MACHNLADLVGILLIILPHAVNLQTLWCSIRNSTHVRRGSELFWNQVIYLVFSFVIEFFGKCWVFFAPDPDPKACLTLTYTNSEYPSILAHFYLYIKFVTKFILRTDLQSEQALSETDSLCHHLKLILLHPCNHVRDDSPLPLKMLK